MRHRLTIQQLANLCNYSWEVERVFGFQISDPIRFKKYVTEASASELRSVLTSLQELFATINEIGLSEVELKADGEHPFLTKLTPAKTPTAAAIGADENLPVGNIFDHM